MLWPTFLPSQLCPYKPTEILTLFCNIFHASNINFKSKMLITFKYTPYHLLTGARMKRQSPQLISPFRGHNFMPDHLYCLVECLYGKCFTFALEGPWDQAKNLHLLPNWEALHPYGSVTSHIHRVLEMCCQGNKTVLEERDKGGADNTGNYMQSGSAYASSSQRYNVCIVRTSCTIFTSSTLKHCPPAAIS